TRAGAPGAEALEADAPGADAPVDIDGVSLRRFGATTGVAAILLGLFVIWVASHPGVHRSTADIDAVVKLVVAALAAASCVVFGRRAAPQVRLAWMWIGAFAAVWAVGAAVLTWYDFGKNRAVPLGSRRRLSYRASTRRNRRPSVLLSSWARRFPGTHAARRRHRGRIASHRELDHRTRHRVPLRLGHRLLPGNRSCLPDKRRDRRHRRRQRPRPRSQPPTSPARARRSRVAMPDRRRQQSRLLESSHVVPVRRACRRRPRGRFHAHRSRPYLAARPEYDSARRGRGAVAVAGRAPLPLCSHRYLRGHPQGH